MVQFSQSELAFRERMERLAEQVVIPEANEIEERREVPQGLRRRLSEEGCIGRIFPKEVGGEEGTQVDLCIQEEMLGYGSLSVAATTLASCLGGIPVYMFGSAEQQNRWLGPLIRAEITGTISITEPDHGSDVAAMESYAYRDGDDWVLNGRKAWIDNTASADIFTVWVKTDREAQPPRRGISTFVIERSRPGLQVEEVFDIMGLRPLGVGQFSFTDVWVPPDNLIGEEGQGWAHVMKMLSYGRTATAAMCVGAAQAALDLAKRYAKERVQFGQPIAQFQAIQLKIADMATAVVTARLLTYEAARMIDQGERADREASMAKFYAAESVMKVAHEALQIHGAWGFHKSNTVERIFRDARIFSIGEGTSEIHRLVVARRELEL